ncbi:DNA primase [Candidatus Woesearchaeota archaeon]|nr:DNA primase [Candidatus Woesearchaeota archaeon]
MKAETRRPFRPSTLKQREIFYKEEFDMRRVRAWFKKNDLPFPQLFAVDLGSETGISRYKGKKDRLIVLRKNGLKGKLVRYLPEDVYYDRNIYKDPEIMLKTLNSRKALNSSNFLGQELAFDVDAENMACSCNKGKRHICQERLQKSAHNAVSLAGLLKGTFKKVGIVYSGRGFHVHVFDRKAAMLSVRERSKLNSKFLRFGIDPWVSKGSIRLMRLPYSLNALVSRVVTPLRSSEAGNFCPISSGKSVPGFLRLGSR